MFTDGLKDLSITELADETGIDRSKIYTYINTGTPNDYEYTRGKKTGAGQAPYLLSERDIEMLSMIHELSQKHSIREVKEILSNQEDVKVVIEDECHKNIVPYFVADFIDENQDKSLPDIMSMPNTNLDKIVYDYLFEGNVNDEEKKQRQITFTNSWVNGYDEVEEANIFERIYHSTGNFEKLKKIYNSIEEKDSPEKRFTALELYVVEQSAERGLQDSIRQDFRY